MSGMGSTAGPLPPRAGRRDRIVVALGGNALIRRGEEGSIGVQRHNLVAAAAALADLAAAGHELVITHGNGPQVGFLALEAELASGVVPVPPLDVLGAESQGQIGYLLAGALRDAFRAAGITRDVAVVLTGTVVDAADPAFGRPTKPVGPVYDEPEARLLAAQRGWSIARDGAGWRRVVPSPRPKRIVEEASIRRLVDAGVLVIAAGGGGVQVVERADGHLEGVEAVIDKDLAAVVLARAVDADTLLLLTDVPAVYVGWGTSEARVVSSLTVDQATSLLRRHACAPGSMAPKVEAAAAFASLPGHRAAIGALEDARAVLDGKTGTTFVRGPAGVRLARADRPRPSGAPRPDRSGRMTVSTASGGPEHGARQEAP